MNADTALPVTHDQAMNALQQLIDRTNVLRVPANPEDADLVVALYIAQLEQSLALLPDHSLQSRVRDLTSELATARRAIAVRDTAIEQLVISIELLHTERDEMKVENKRLDGIRQSQERWIADQLKRPRRP